MLEYVFLKREESPGESQSEIIFNIADVSVTIDIDKIWKIKNIEINLHEFSACWWLETEKLVRSTVHCFYARASRLRTELAGESENSVESRGHDDFLIACHFGNAESQVN